MALLAMSTYHCIDTLSHFPLASKILIPFFIFSFLYDARIVMVPSYVGSCIIIFVIFVTSLPSEYVLNLILKERGFIQANVSWLLRWLFEGGSSQQKGPGAFLPSAFSCSHPLPGSCALPPRLSTHTTHLGMSHIPTVLSSFCIVM